MSSLPPTPPHPQQPPTAQFNFLLQVDPSTKRILAGTPRNGHPFRIRVSQQQAPPHSSPAHPLRYDAARWPDLARPGAVDLGCRLHRAAAPDRNDLLTGPTYTVCGFEGPQRWGLAAWIL